MFSTNNFVEIKVTEKNSFQTVIESGTIEEFLMWTYNKMLQYPINIKSNSLIHPLSHVSRN